MGGAIDGDSSGVITYALFLWFIPLFGGDVSAHSWLAGDTRRNACNVAVRCVVLSLDRDCPFFSSVLF